MCESVDSLHIRLSCELRIGIQLQMEWKNELYAKDCGLQTHSQLGNALYLVNKETGLQFQQRLDLQPASII